MLSAMRRAMPPIRAVALVPIPVLLVLLLLLLLSAPAVVAQTPVPSSPLATTPAPPARPAAVPRRQERRSESDEEMIAAAHQVLALIDAGRAEEIWEGASPSVRRIVPRAEFLMQVEADRARLGAPISRGELALSRERYVAGGRVPQGEYVNIAFPTRFTNTDAPVRELVSFRLDEDRVWRVSGYSLR
jgi:hypothetical protein